MKLIDEYALWASLFWHGGRTLPLEPRDYVIMGLGLTGEAVEVVEQIKKFVSDGRMDEALLKKKLGAQIFYWARICTAFGLRPSEVLQANMEKLSARRLGGVLRGNGSER